jgi:hypothetical protein
MEKSPNIGTLINWIFSIHHSKYGEDGEQLVKFINKNFVTDGISQRNLDRVRNTTDFPSTKTIKKLQLKVPEISILDPLTMPQRLLLLFDAIKREQHDIQNLSEGFKISIVASSWSPPQASSNDAVATALAENINNGIYYEFIYPSLDDHPELLGGKKIKSEVEAEGFLHDTLQTLVFDIGEKIKNLDTSSNPLFTKTRDALQKARNGITFISTGYTKNKVSLPQQKENWKKRSVLFWLLMPSRYVVLYNLGRGVLDKEEYLLEEKGGSFFVTGQVLRGDIVDQGFESKGWLHMNYSEYKEIENEYNNYKQYWTEIKIEESIIEKMLTGK